MLLTYRLINQKIALQNAYSKLEEEQHLHKAAWQLFEISMRQYLACHKVEKAHQIIADEKLAIKNGETVSLDKRVLKVERDHFNKPYLVGYPEIYFNLSHCSGLVACVIHSKPIGIDVEHIRYFPDTVMKKVCHVEEQNWVKKSTNSRLEFFKLWTLKESYLKAIGTGLQTSMKEICFNLSRREEILSNHKDYRFRQSIIKDTFVLSVCEKV